jgi:uncharacterized damage-inducible protein DinB
MTPTFLKMFLMARSRLLHLLPVITENDLSKRLDPESNSIGFLLKHIAEVEQLFAKNVFGLEIKVTANTIGKTKDSGRYINLSELLESLSAAEKVLTMALQSQKEEDWESNVTTAEFGTITKAEALARIISHTAYHSGQIALILKYG